MNFLFYKIENRCLDLRNKKKRNMKNCLIMLVIGLAMSCTNAQKSSGMNVPEAISNAFAKKYPSVKKVSWEKENSNYEGEFMDGKIEKSVVFDANGTFLEEETEINVSVLPAIIVDYCKMNYENHKMTEAAKIVNAKGDVSYEAEMRKGGKEFDVIFDAQGNVISSGD